MRKTKIFNTILLFFITFIVVGQEIEQFPDKTNHLYEYMLQNKTQINLTQGIDVDSIVKKQLPFDYKDFITSAKEYSFYHPQISTDNNFLVGSFDNYYQLDFAADPFDGRIQIMVMGEPLPSPAVTMICALGVVGILLYYKKRKEVEA